MNHDCSYIIERLVDNGDLLPILIVGTTVILGSLVAIIAIIFTTIGRVSRTRAKESTKRELAAYVAEGSLRPEDAVAILNADRPKWESSDIDEIRKLFGKKT